MAEPRIVEVDPDQDGLRLDAFLTALLPELSRSQLQRLVKTGQVSGPLPAGRAAKPLRPSTATDMPRATVSSTFASTI